MTSTTAKTNNHQANEDETKTSTTTPAAVPQAQSSTTSSRKLKQTSARNDIDTATRLTNSTTYRLWTRGVIVISVSVLVYFYTQKQKDENVFAKAHEKLPLRMQKFPCSPSYQAEIQDNVNCVPNKCGRLVADQLVEPGEVDILLNLAKRVIGKAGSSGGASILDMHTGALSYKQEFINVYSVPEIGSEIQEQHLKVYNFVKGKIRLALAEQFGIPASSLHLTYPTFFSRITNETAKTIHDEYWHEHIDKETYPSFHYSSLLYLNTYNKDFKGGRFVFVDGIGKNRTAWTIEPKKGRVNAFTSGAENRHFVEQVTEGERYAITIAFTCNEKLGISDPHPKVTN